MASIKEGILGNIITRERQNNTFDERGDVKVHALVLDDVAKAEAVWDDRTKAKRRQRVSSTVARRL